MPDEGKRSGKYVKFVSGLAVLLLILSPLRGLSDFTAAVRRTLKTSVTVSETPDMSYADAVTEKTAEGISDGIIRILSGKYSMDREKIRVRIVLNEEDPDNVEICEIQVFTSEKDKTVRESAAEFLSRTLLCEVHVFGP